MRSALVFVLLSAFIQPIFAADFTGIWNIDICSDQDKKSCGEAEFSLIQKGTIICGDHSFYPAGLSRVNEGEPGSVRGTVVGDTAVLVVRSGRNGAIVLGTARLAGSNLDWKYLNVEILPGDPPGDDLILDSSLLHRKSKKILDMKLLKACG